MLKRLWFVAASAVLLAAGCSNSPGSADAGTADQACADFATGACTQTNSCFPFLLKLGFSDAATCSARLKLACTASIGAPGSTVTPASLSSCTQANATRSCEDARLGVIPAACKLTGTLAAGTACGSPFQCQSGYCKITQGNCGVCSTKAAGGGNCGSTADCEDGLACNGGVCKTPGAAGAACSASAPCKANLYCKTSTCAQPATAAGAACDANAGSCDLALGLYCGTSSVCANIQLAMPGNACGTVGGNLTYCQAGSCKVGLFSGTCVGLVADGQTCDSQQSLNCEQPATCVSGACKLPNPGACM